MKPIRALKHSIILAFLLFVTLSEAEGQYMDPQGTYLVAPVTDDTLIVFGGTGFLNPNKYTTSNGYFYIDYTGLSATDGTMQFGVMVNENGVNKFVPGTDVIVLSNSTAQVTINGVDKYMFDVTDADTTWQLHVSITNLPGDALALKYYQHTADTGSFKYKVKALR